MFVSDDRVGGAKVDPDGGGPLRGQPKSGQECGQAGEKDGQSDQKGEGTGVGDGGFVFRCRFHYHGSLAEEAQRERVVRWRDWILVTGFSGQRRDA